MGYRSQAGVGAGDLTRPAERSSAAARALATLDSLETKIYFPPTDCKHRP